MKNNGFRADLRAFGPIGFQKFWCEEAQRQCRQEDLLEKIVMHGIQRGVHIIGINTEDSRVSPGYPEDRYGFLRSQIGRLRSTGYNVLELGENLMFISSKESSSRCLWIVNTQTVHLLENGRMLKHLVVGTNRIKNGLSLPETIAQCNYPNPLLPNFLMASTPSFNNQEYLEMWKRIDPRTVTGFVAHESTFCWPDEAKYFPLIGAVFGKYSKTSLDFAKSYSSRVQKPWI